MASKGTSVADLVASVRKHKNFKRLAAYSMQALVKTAAPPNIGWQDHAREAFACGAAPVLAEVLAKDPEDAELLTCGLQALGAMASAGAAKGMLPQVTEEPHSILDTFATFWASAQRATSGSGADDDDLEAAVSISRSFTSTTLSCAAAGPDAAVEAGVLGGILAFLPHPEDDGDAEDAAQLPVDGLHAPTPMRLALQAMAACLRCKDALAVLAEPEALSRVVGACRVFDDDSVHSNKHILHGFRVADRLSRSEIGLQALRADGTLVARLAPAVEWAQRWPAAGAIGVRVLTRIVGQDVATLVSKAGGVDAEGAAVNVREAQFTAGLLASLASDASIVEQLLADDGALLLQVARLISTDAPSPRVAFSAMQAVRRAIATSGRAIIDAALAVGVPDFVCGLLRDEGMTRPGVEPFLLAEGLGLLSALLVSREAAAAVNAAQGGHVHAWALQVAQMPASQDGVVAAACARYARALQLHAHWPEGVDACQWLAALVQLMGTFDEVPTLQLFGSEVLAGALRGPAASAAAAAAATLRAGIVKVLAAALKLAAEAGGSSSVSGSDDSPGSPSRSRSGSATHLGGVDDASAAAAALEGDSASKRRAASVLKRTPTIAGRLKPKRTVVPTEAATRVDGASLAVAAIELAAALRLAGGEEAMTKLNDGGTVSELLSAFLAHDSNVLVAGAYLLAVEVLLTEDAVDAAVRQLSGALNLIRESCVDKDLFSIARGELAGPGLLHSSDVTSGSLSGSVLGAAMDSIDSMKLLQAAAVSTRLAYHLIQSDGASLLVTFLSVLTLIKGVASLGKAPGGGGKGKAAGMGGKGANSRRLMGKLKTAVLLGGRRSMVERDKSLPETFQEDLLAATANVLANLIRLGSNQGAAGITQASSAAEAFTRRMLWTRRASPERVATLRAAATSRKAGSSLSPEARAVGLALLKPAVAKTAVKALNNKVHLQTAASSVCGMLGAMAAGDSVAVGILAAMVDVGSVEALTAALRTHAAAALVLVDRAARAMAVVAGWGLPTEDSFGAEAVATRGGSRQVLRELTTAFGSGDKRGKAAVANRWMGLEADGAGKVGPGAFLSASHLLHAVSGYEAGASLLKKQGAVDVLLSTLDALAEVESGEGASAKGTHGALAQCRTVLTEVLTRLADASSVDDACSMLSRLTSTISSGKVKASTLRTAGIALTTLCALASSADGSASWSDVAAACQNLLAIAQGVRDGSVTLPPSVTLASLAPLLNQAVQLLSSLLAAGDTQREGWVDIALGSIPVLLNSLGEGSGDGSLAPADLLRALAAAVTSPEAASAVMAEESTLDSVLAMLTAAVDDWDPASVSAGMTLLARCADGGATDALAERGAHLLALRTAQDAIATAPALAAEWGPGSAADTASLALQAAASMAQSNAQAAADLSAAAVESVGIAASAVCARGIARICSAEQPLAEDFLGSALNLQLVLCSACGEEPLPPAQPADRLALGLRKALLAAVKAGAGREEYGTAAASALPLSLCVTSACTLETAHVADADALDDIREVLKRAGARDILIAAVSQSGVASEVVTAASQALAALDGGAGKAGAAGVATALRQQVLALRRHRLKVVSKAGHDAAARHRAVHFVRAVSRVGTAVSKLSATLASDPVLPSDVSQYVIAAVQEAMVALSACLGTLQDTAAVEFEEESATAAGAAEDEDEDEDEGLFVELDVSAGLGASAAALSALLQALARAWAAACADGEGTSTAETYLGEPSAVEALNTEVAQMDAEDASASAAELGSGSSGARLVARLGVFGACLALRSFMDAHGAPWTMDEEAGVSILQGVQSVLTALFPGSPALDAQGWAAVQSTGLLTLLTAVERGRTEAPDSISHMAQSAAADVLQHAIHAVLHHAPADGDSWPADTVQMIPSVLCAVVLAPSDSWVRELVRGLRAVLPSSAANAEPKAPAAGQLWAVLHALQEGGHTVHGPCLAVSPRGKVTLLDDSVQWDSSHPVVRSACSALSTALQQPPVDVKGPPCSRYDMPVLPLLPSLVHTAVASLHRAPKGSAEAPSESSPGPRHARTSTSMGAAGASPAQAASDPAAHWWAVDSTCSPDASAKVFSLLPALRALSHTDLDSAVVELRACEGLPGVASFSASVENAAPLLTESSVQHLKQWLGADVVVACAIVQVLRRVAGLGARAPHAANAARIERMASSGLLAAAAAGLVGAGSAGAGAQPSTEVADSAEHDVDLASLLPYELLSMEVVRLLADVALGDLDTTAMPGSGPLPDAVEALVVSALSGEGHSGVGVKACGFTEASLAALGGATKRIAVICGEEHPFHRRARTILAALGRVFEAYSGEGFAKALKAASKAAGVVMAEGAVPAEGEEAPPDGPWSELVSRLALLHRVCMNVDGDAIPQIPREDMEPLAGLLQLGAFQTHKEVSFRALLGIARACDNVQNLGCAIDAQVHRGLGKSLEAHPQDVDTVDVALTGLRPMTVSLQYLGDLKQAGIVPLVTKAGKDHAAAQLQPPPYKQIMTDEDAKDYPRIAHFAVQILANIACDKEMETVSDVLPADALVGAEEEHGGESMSGGVLRVVLAGGVEALGCIMSQHLDNPRILEDAMCALSNMAFTTDSVRLGIGRQCSTTVVQSLKVFDSDPYLFSMALRAIGNLTRCDENIVSVMAHGVGQGVQSGMEQCAEHPDALQVAADVVGNLASIDDQHLDKAQAVRALEAGLRLRAEAAGSTSEPMTQEELMAMDLAVVVAEWLYDDGVPQVLAETMKANYADSSIVSACLRAIQYLTETPSVLLRLTQRTSLAADVVFVMRSCDHDAELCLRGGFLLAQMLKPMVSDLEEQERIAAVTRKACMEAGVQTVLLSVLDTHRREDYVVSQLIKIANLASKDEHLATICTAAVQLKTATSLLWVARRSAVAIVHPERLEAFDAADRRGALDDEEDEEDDEEEGGRAAGGAPGVETMEMPLAGSSDGAVVHNRDLRKVDPMQLCQQALGLLSVWAEDPDFSQAVATEVGEACVELYRTFDEAKQHALQYAVLRVMARVAGTQPACVALVKVQGVPEILGQFCWDQDRMLTDKVSSKAVELTGALSGASFQGASLLVEAGVNWVVEALALRYAILGEDAPYAACGAVLESLYTGEARFRKLARNKRSSGGARRLQLAAVLEDLTEEGSEEADGEAEAAEESAEEVPEWQARMVAGIVPFDDFPKGTLAALTSGAELDIWFCPFMHRSGKVKVRTMRVKLDSSLNLIQVLYFSSRQQCDLLWAVALRDATAIRVGAPTHGIKRQIFRRSAKAERSLCIDGPASAAYNRGADGTVQQEAETADEGGEAGKAPITLLHIELSSPDEAVEVRNVLSMVQSFSRCQKAISVAGIKSKLALGGLEDVAGEPEPPVEETAAQE